MIKREVHSDPYLKRDPQKSPSIEWVFWVFADHVVWLFLFLFSHNIHSQQKMTQKIFKTQISSTEWIQITHFFVLFFALLRFLIKFFALNFFACFMNDLLGNNWGGVFNVLREFLGVGGTASISFGFVIRGMIFLREGGT